MKAYDVAYRSGYHVAHLTVVAGSEAAAVKKAMADAKRQGYGAKPSPSHVVCHIDGDRRNNHFLNLRWGTPQDNVNDNIRLGRHRIPKRVPGCKGSKRPAKPDSFREQQIRAVKLLLEHKTSQHTIARLLGIHRSTIANISAGYYWKHIDQAAVVAP